MTSRAAGDRPGPIAEDLLRVVVQASQGSLPRYGVRERAGTARRLDVALRAGLFCDLARAGVITGTHGPVAPSGLRSTGPRPADGGGSEDGCTDVEDRILAAILATVAHRPNVAWSRWFRHVRQDRAALVARLVRSGRWTAQGGNRFLDADPSGAARLQARTFTVSELIEGAADDRATVLGYLYVLTGPSMSPEHALAWDKRLATLDATPGGTTVRAVLAAAGRQLGVDGWGGWGVADGHLAGPVAWADGPGWLRRLVKISAERSAHPGGWRPLHRVVRCR